MYKGWQQYTNPAFETDGKRSMKYICIYIYAYIIYIYIYLTQKQLTFYYSGNCRQKGWVQCKNIRLCIHIYLLEAACSTTHCGTVWSYGLIKLRLKIMARRPLALLIEKKTNLLNSICKMSAIFQRPTCRQKGPCGLSCCPWWTKYVFRGRQKVQIQLRKSINTKLVSRNGVETGIVRVERNVLVL